MRARQRTDFFCFALERRPKESQQRKAPPLAVTHSCAVGKLLLAMPGGGRTNSLRSNKHGPFSACHGQKQARPKGLGLACVLRMELMKACASLGDGLSSMENLLIKTWRQTHHTGFDAWIEARERA